MRVRALLALLGVLLLCALSSPVSYAAPLATTSTDPLTVALDSISPRSPDATVPGQPVKIVATITNTTDNTYSNVQFGLQRGLPVTQQNLLADAISTPPVTEYDVPSPLALPGQLLPHASTVVTYKTTANDLCLCFTGVYPYALVVTAIGDPNVGPVEVGRTQVFVPSFLSTPKPVTVGWVWPLLDKPHRTIDENVFDDESLAGEVGPGGRLDRALRVAELVAGKVPLTLVIDPDLLDSLQVMASPAGYKVRTASGSIVAGTGGKLAAAWLARLKAVKDFHEVVLTAYADPDVNAVARAGLKWSTALDPQVQARIAPILDGASSDLLTWPIGGALTSQALDALVGGGASTVLLSDAALPGQNQTEPTPNALSPLPSAAGKAQALVTDTAIENTVRRTVTAHASLADDQQTLLAQLAVRAAEDPANSHFVVIAPDHYVNPDPAAAAATILATVRTTWSKAISLPEAIATVTPVDRGALQTSAENPSAEISADALAQLSNIQQQVSSMNDALHDNDSSAVLLAGFNNGFQRAESSAWRTDPAGGAKVIQALQDRIDTLIGDVHLVQPAVGTYSLSSANSPIVVTVANELPRAVTVQVAVDPGTGVLGFTATDLAPQTIPAHSIETIRIATHVQRLGRFQVVASLRTPDGRQLGQPIDLTLRSTAIGTVTKIITVVAISVLVLALLRRLILRLRDHQRRGHGNELRTAE